MTVIYRRRKCLPRRVRNVSRNTLEKVLHTMPCPDPLSTSSRLNLIAFMVDGPPVHTNNQLEQKHRCIDPSNGPDNPRVHGFSHQNANHTTSSQGQSGGTLERSVYTPLPLETSVSLYDAHTDSPRDRMDGPRHCKLTGSLVASIRHR